MFGYQGVTSLVTPVVKVLNQNMSRWVKSIYIITIKYLEMITLVFISKNNFIFIKNKVFNTYGVIQDFSLGIVQQASLPH